MELQFSGIKLDKADQGMIIQNVEKLARKKDYIKSLTLHIDKYAEEGSKAKFSVKATADTDFGPFSVDAFAYWQLNLAIKDILKKLMKNIHGHIRKHRGD